MSVVGRALGVYPGVPVGNIVGALDVGVIVGFVVSTTGTTVAGPVGISDDGVVPPIVGDVVSPLGSVVTPDGAGEGRVSGSVGASVTPDPSAVSFAGVEEADGSELGVELGVELGARVTDFGMVPLSSRLGISNVNS